jgi:hypothetical protein
VVEHIVDRPKSVIKETEDDKLLECYRRQSTETRLLAYELLIEKFNTKYSTILDDNQKTVLREYIYNIANTSSLGDFVKIKITEIKNQLMEVIKKVDDNVVRIKINEVVNQLDKSGPKSSIVRDNQILTLLLSYELLKEIRKQVGIKVDEYKTIS